MRAFAPFFSVLLSIMSFSGRWIGGIDIQRETTVFKLNASSGGAPTVDLLPSGPAGLPVQGLSSEATSLRFEVSLESAPVTFAGSRTGDEIAGTVRRGAAEGRFRLIRIAEVDAGRRTALFGNYETETDG